MKPIKCRTAHNPPYSYGDCVRACLASIMEDDGFPDVFNGCEPSKGWGRARSYLKDRGYNLALFTVDQPFEFMQDTNPDMFYMLLGRTERANHAVVCKNDLIVHDPAISPTRFVDGTELGWIIGVIVRA